MIVAVDGDGIAVVARIGSAAHVKLHVGALEIDVAAFQHRSCGLCHFVGVDAHGGRTTDSAFDDTAAEIGMVASLDAACELACHLHPDRVACHADDRVAFQSAAVILGHLHVDEPAVKIHGAVVVGVDAVGTAVGDVHRAAIHDETAVFPVSHRAAALTAVDAVGHRPEDVDCAGGRLQLKVFLHAKRMLRVALHVQRAFAFYLQMSLAIESGFLCAVAPVGEGVDRSLHQFHLGTLAALDMQSRPLAARQVHSIEVHGQFVTSVQNKRTITRLARQHI